MFLLRTRTTVEESTHDLAIGDLFDNIEAACNTVRVLTDELDPLLMDTAYAFNAWCWQGHTLSLMAYASHMCHSYLAIPSVAVLASQKAIVRSRLADLDETISIFAGETSETMKPPTWINNDQVHIAHRKYLVWRNANVYAARFGIHESDGLPTIVPLDGLSAFVGC